YPFSPAPSPFHGSVLFVGSIKNSIPNSVLTRACLQLGGLCARTDQNQTRNIVLLCSAAGTLGIHKSVAQRLMRGRHYGGPTHAALWIARRPMGADKGFFARP